MSGNEQKLYDPHIPRGTNADPQTAHSPPSANISPQSPPSFPTQTVFTYQPVPVLLSTNSTSTVVDTSPTGSVESFTIDQPKRPPDYLMLNLITLCCCCFLFGLVGLFFSYKVRDEWKIGNHLEAKMASKSALNYGITGVVVGLFLNIGYILVAIFESGIF